MDDWTQAFFRPGSVGYAGFCSWGGRPFAHCSEDGRARYRGTWLGRRIATCESHAGSFRGYADKAEVSLRSV